MFVMQTKTLGIAVSLLYRTATSKFWMYKSLDTSMHLYIKY